MRRVSTILRLEAGGNCRGAKTRCGVRVAALLALAACLGLTPFSSASAAAEAVNGSWVINVDATLSANKDWSAAYNACNEREKTGMRAAWSAKTLVIRLDKGILQVFVNDTLTQDAAVLSVTEEGRDTRVVVARKDDKESAYPLDFIPLSENGMRLVIDNYTIIVLAKNATGGAGRR